MSTVRCIECNIVMTLVRSDKKYCSLCFKEHFKKLRRFRDRGIVAKTRYQRYRNTNKYRKYARERYQKMPLLVRQARYFIHNAIRDGKITRSKNCQNCGISDWGIGRSMIEAHHAYGYEKKNWLMIQWLCVRCHKNADKLLRKEGQ